MHRPHLAKVKELHAHASSGKGEGVAHTHTHTHSGKSKGLAQHNLSLAKVKELHALISPGKVKDLHAQTSFVPHLPHPIGVRVVAQPTAWPPPPLHPPGKSEGLACPHPIWQM